MVSKQVKGLLLWGSLVVVGWLLALFWVPPDQSQGEVYRILYLHVPVSFAAFFSAGVLCWHSIQALIKPNVGALLSQRAAVEVGLVFTILTLATGSIWGKPTWGVWWTWDARVTTTLILAVLFASYLIFYDAIPSELGRMKTCSILGIVIAADIPIIYKSVNWWRTLHQPQTIIRSGGASMSSEMLYLLIYCAITMLVFGFWLIRQRRHTLILSKQLEEQQLSQFS